MSLGPPTWASGSWADAWASGTWSGSSTSVPTGHSSAVPRVDLALGGSFRSLVVSANPTAWWRFAEQSGYGTAVDSSGNGFSGINAGGVTTAEVATTPEGGYSYKFDGINGRSGVSGLAALGLALTLECWVKPNAPSATGAILTNAAGSIYFGVTAARNLTMFYNSATHLSSGTLTDAAWSHVAVSITALGVGTFYINGAASGTFTSWSSGWTPTQIGCVGTSTLPFKGWLEELVLYGGTTFTASQVADHYLAGFWTDVTADVIAPDQLESAFGIGGNGPKDRLSGLGICAFSLRNDDGNSGGLRGYYSPSSNNCRDGFGHGILCRVVYTYSDTDYQRFIGKVASIDPEPGRYKSRRTRVVVHDLMDDIIETDLRNIKLQLNKTETDLQRLIMEALPATSQPLAISLDSGVDACPFAFDTLGAGAKAVVPLADLLNSSLGYGHVNAMGVYVYENRHNRQLRTSTYTFNDDMIGLVVPTTLEGCFNHVRAVAHPKTVSPATVVLYSAPTATAAQPSHIEIGPGAVIEVWGSYFNASVPEQQIGGTSFVAPVATTDYLANSVADGTGTNKTANVTVRTGSVAAPTEDCFASTVKFTITNNDASTVYITKLQLRGTALYDNSPLAVESVSVQGYGDHPIDIDMPYQSDANVAQDLADYLRSQFESLATQAFELTFIGNDSPTLMECAMNVAVGDRITITETQTGLNAADVFVQSVRLLATHIKGGSIVTCTLGLTATSFFDQVWVMDDPALSLAGTSTYFGFA